MIKIGKRQKMIVDRFTSVGAYLTEVEKDGEERSFNIYGL